MDALITMDRGLTLIISDLAPPLMKRFSERHMQDPTDPSKQIKVPDENGVESTSPFTVHSDRGLDDLVAKARRGVNAWMDVLALTANGVGGYIKFSILANDAITIAQLRFLKQ